LGESNAEGVGQSLEILVRGVGNDVEVLRWSHVAMGADGEPADDYVLDTVLVQVLQQRDRIKRVGHP
jgi:hypothetical protein